MTMKYLSLIILLFITIGTSRAQKILKYTRNLYGVARDTGPTLWVSDRPVTNREYLTYVLWMMNTYGQDYPLTVVETLPYIFASEEDGFSERVAFAEKPLEIYTKGTPDIVGLYFLNVTYLDYPVVGLTWYQASRFNKWLADRYNEYTLIKSGYLDFNPEQIDAECFVTEAFLVKQYDGYTEKTNDLKWCDGILIPSFRLPTFNELDELKTLMTLNAALKSYPNGLPAFLTKWANLYIETNDTCMILHRDIYNPDNILVVRKPKKSINPSEIELTELTSGTDIPYSYDYRHEWLDRGLKVEPIDNYRNIEFEFPTKDSLGLMPFIIIGEYDSGTPMVLEHFKKIDPKHIPSEGFTIFRTVLNFGK
jgi:hypothetical protein